MEENTTCTPQLKPFWINHPTLTIEESKRNFRYVYAHDLYLITSRKKHLRLYIGSRYVLVTFYPKIAEELMPTKLRQRVI